MRVAKVIALLGVFEIGAVVWHSVGVWLGWWSSQLAASTAVFAVGVCMLVAGCAYTEGWRARGVMEAQARWARTRSVASVPSGAGTADASLSGPYGRQPDLLLPRRVDPVDQCALGGRSESARCQVPGCAHVATEPRGPGWSRLGPGWVCPCDSRHLLIRSHPTGDT